MEKYPAKGIQQYFNGKRRGLQIYNYSNLIDILSFPESPGSYLGVKSKQNAQNVFTVNWCQVQPFP